MVWWISLGFSLQLGAFHEGKLVNNSGLTSCLPGITSTRCMSPLFKSVTFKDVESIDYFHTETKICRLVQEIFGPYSVGHRTKTPVKLKLFVGFSLLVFHL